MIVTKGMYDKEFKFNNNGKEETIIIKPLSTKFLPKLFKVVREFSSIEQSEDDSQNTSLMLEKFATSDVLESLIELVTETVKKSYPDLDAQSIDEFVSANLFKLLPFIIEVNFKN